jgi:hypothetical protein
VERGGAEVMKVRSGPGISLANANEHPTEAVCSPPGKQRNVNPAKATPAAGLRAHQGMERAPCTGTLASPRRTRLGRAAWVPGANAPIINFPLTEGPSIPAIATKSNTNSQATVAANSTRRAGDVPGTSSPRARLAADSAAPGRWLYCPPLAAS